PHNIARAELSGSSQILRGARAQGTRRAPQLRDWRADCLYPFGEPGAHAWRRDVMNRSRYGMMAGLAGAAFAWWYRKRRGARSMPHTRTDSGEVIYSNTPVVP